MLVGLLNQTYGGMMEKYINFEDLSQYLEDKTIDRIEGIGMDKFTIHFKDDTYIKISHLGGMEIEDTNIEEIKNKLKSYE